MSKMLRREGSIVLTADDMDELFLMYNHMQGWRNMEMFRIHIGKKGWIKLDGYTYDEDQDESLQR